MTPQEIYQYRVKWIAKGDYQEITIHSDRYESAVSWCRENLKDGCWKSIKWSSPYQSCFLFESYEDYKDFIEMNG